MAKRLSIPVMRSARCGFLFLLVAAVVPTALFAGMASQDIPEIKANDNRLPHGQLKAGVLTIELEARVGVWHPEDRDGPSPQVQAFAEAGQPLEIPGPMIRVPRERRFLSTFAMPSTALVWLSTVLTQDRAARMTQYNSRPENVGKFGSQRANRAPTITGRQRPEKLFQSAMASIVN
jgi:hypothetical protein